MKFPDARWFSDKRPNCAIENEIKNELGATNDFQYSAELQKNGMKVFNDHIRKEPKVSVSNTVVPIQTQLPGNSKYFELN